MALVTTIDKKKYIEMFPLTDAVSVFSLYDDNCSSKELINFHNVLLSPNDIFLDRRNLKKVDKGTVEKILKERKDINQQDVSKVLKTLCNYGSSKKKKEDKEILQIMKTDYSDSEEDEEEDDEEDDEEEEEDIDEEEED